MIKISGGNLFAIFKRFFRQINAPYRLTVINEESMEKGLTVHLTKKSVYIFLSTVLVLIFLLLSSLLLFTPLRFYIPGNNSNTVTRTELMKLKKLSDSLEKINTIREQYIYNLLLIANGTLNSKSDSAMLTEKEIELAGLQNLNKIDHAKKYDYLKNVKADSTDETGTGVKDTLQKNSHFKEKN